MISGATRSLCGERFDALGLALSFGDHVEEMDQFVSATIEHRAADLHAAFTDSEVDAILTVIGGFNSNQLLPYLDWELIAANPKILCGYSDITALACAIYAKTGLVTYSGPHYSTFGMRDHFDQTLDWFRDALFVGGEQEIAAAATWSDDEWYLDDPVRDILTNEGHWVLQPGEANGTLVGGNQCTLNLLQGTQYMPDLADTVLFLEDDFEADPHTFDRDLTSLTQQPGFDGVQGLLIGRFQKSVEMTRGKLQAIVDSKRELHGIPVIANVDFGHTDPLMTIPIGGAAQIHGDRDGDETNIVLDHGVSA